MIPKLGFRRALWAAEEQINDWFCPGKVGICFENPFFARRRRSHADADVAAFARVEEIAVARLSRKSCSIASAATGLEYKYP
jgi:hypothetical protein